VHAVYTSILNDCSVCIVANINNKNAGILLNRTEISSLKGITRFGGYSILGVRVRAACSIPDIHQCNAAAEANG